jgi:hypothetical protein
MTDVTERRYTLIRAIGLSAGFLGTVALGLLR